MKLTLRRGRESAQTLTPTFPKKFGNVKELTNHAMQQRKQELLKEIEKGHGKNQNNSGGTPTNVLTRKEAA